jgi:predicted membrane protein (TIGR00267 family)
VSIKNQLELVIRVSQSGNIARRYFVVNGFDGALAMLGIIMGFYAGGNEDISTVINACIGAAVALGVSGFSSAYVSEAAERKQELQTLESAMLGDLSDSAHGQAARAIPFLIAFVNGAAPLFFAILIMIPLWFAPFPEHVMISPLETSIATAFGIIFFLGIFLGQVSGAFWLWSGTRTLLIGILTAALVMLLTPG